MGAVVNMRPDLFKAVVADVPFVDVINTMLDESLPLTVGEFEEWGNPKKPDEYDVHDELQPVRQRRAQKAYPTMLVRTALNDSQVMYWEPAKWVARLRAHEDRHATRSLFKINMDPAGHGGASGRYDKLRETRLRLRVPAAAARREGLTRRAAVAADEVVDELARDAERGGHRRQRVGREPAGVGELGRIGDDLAARPTCAVKPIMSEPENGQGWLPK